MRPVKKAQMEKNEHGEFILTEKYLRELCEENEQYMTPKLNSCLYLHYKGFSKIEALEKYVNLACLWLESNGIRQIENISHLEELRTVYLHQNIISKIEGISTLTKLVTLNLSHNNIKVIENLGGCYSLKNLDLSHNMIEEYQNCAGLKDCPSLTSVDLSSNYIEYDDGFLPFLFKFQNLLCFYFKGNPAIRKVKMYRKVLINGLKKLVYLDERPVKKIDRLAAQAWAEGGFELENQVRKEILEEEHKKNVSFVKNNQKLQEEYEKYRAIKIANIKADTKEKKDKLVNRQLSLRDMIRRARPNTEEKHGLEEELINVDQELNNDMFEILNDNEIVVPPMRLVSDQRNQPEYRRRQLEARRDEREREARDREHQEYLDRERVDMPKASGIIPVPKPQEPQIKSRAQRMKEEGCVMSTDSESENDPTIVAKRAGYRKEMFKWTEFYEGKLEELLVNHMFDFITASHEFSAMVNNFEDETREDKFYYEITPKILQMKWTDVEIKKYRMHELTKDKDEELEESDEEETQVQSFSTDAPVRTYVQNNQDTMIYPKIGEKTEPSMSLVNRLHEFSSSSDEEVDGSYTNLEELD